MLSLSLHKYGNENIMLSLFAFKFYGCIKIREQMQLVFFLIFVSAFFIFLVFVLIFLDLCLYQCVSGTAELTSANQIKNG